MGAKCNNCRLPCHTVQHEAVHGLIGARGELLKLQRETKERTGVDLPIDAILGHISRADTAIKLCRDTPGDINPSWW